LLARDYNPRIKAALCRLAEVAALEDEWLEAEAERCAAGLLQVAGAGTVVLALEGWRRLPGALRRRVLRVAFSRLAGAVGVDYEHLVQLERLCRDAAGEEVLCLPGGVFARRSYNEVMLGFKAQMDAETVVSCWTGARGVSPPQVPAGGYFCPLSVPGEVGGEEEGFSLQARLLPRAELAALPSGLEAALDYARVALPLTLRTRRPGERFRPLGAPGEKKLQDFFVDRKVPRHLRDAWPVVADASGVVWVVGLEIAERVRVSEATREVLFLRWVQSSKAN